MLLTENYLAFDPSQSNDNLYKIEKDTFEFWNSNRSRSYDGDLIKTYFGFYDKDNWFDGNELSRLQEYAKTGKHIPVVISTINKIEVDPSLDPQPSAEDIAKWEDEMDTPLGVFYLDSYSSNIDGISCSNSITNTTFFISSDDNTNNLTAAGFHFPFKPVSDPDSDSGSGTLE